jgi:IS1 family transposase
MQDFQSTIQKRRKTQLIRRNSTWLRVPILFLQQHTGLVEKLKKFNPNVYYTPNVGDYEKFKNVKDLKKTLPEDLESIPRPRIGFTGAVDEYKFDKELFKKIASDYRDIHL